MRRIRRSSLGLLAVVALALAGSTGASAHTLRFDRFIHITKQLSAKPPASLVRIAKAHQPKVGQKIPAAVLREAKAARRHGIVRSATATGFILGSYCHLFGFPSYTGISNPVVQGSNQYFYDYNVAVGSNGIISSWVGPFWQNPVYTATYKYYYNGSWGNNGISTHPDLDYGFNLVGSSDGQYPEEYYYATEVTCN